MALLEWMVEPARHELGIRAPRIAPALDAAQLVRRCIDCPERSRRPFEIPADGLDYLSRRVGGVGLVTEDPRDSELRCESLLGLPARGDVVEKSDAVAGAVGPSNNVDAEVRPDRGAVVPYVPLVDGILG